MSISFALAHFKFNLNLKSNFYSDRWLNYDNLLFIMVERFHQVFLSFYHSFFFLFSSVSTNHSVQEKTLFHSSQSILFIFPLISFSFTFAIATFSDKKNMLWKCNKFIVKQKEKNVHRVKRDRENVILVVFPNSSTFCILLFFPVFSLSYFRNIAIIIQSIMSTE